MCLASIICFILGFIEVGIVIYHLAKYWNNSNSITVSGVMAIVFVNLACAIAYFSMGLYLNGWL